MSFSISSLDCAWVSSGDVHSNLLDTSNVFFFFIGGDLKPFLPIFSEFETKQLKVFSTFSFLAMSWFTFEEVFAEEIFEDGAVFVLECSSLG